MVWYGMVWYGMVWYDMIWYGMVWYGIVQYGIVQYSIAQYSLDLPHENNAVTKSHGAGQIQEFGSKMTDLKMMEEIRGYQLDMGIGYGYYNPELTLPGIMQLLRDSTTKLTTNNE